MEWWYLALHYGCFQLLQYHLGRHQPHYRIHQLPIFYFSKPLFQRFPLLLLWFLLCNLSILSFVFCFSFWLLLCLCNFRLIISSCNTGWPLFKYRTKVRILRRIKEKFCYFLRWFCGNLRRIKEKFSIFENRINFCYPYYKDNSI